jgi:hypothetical protein
MQKRQTINRILIYIGVGMSWVAIVLQLYLIIVNRQASVTETIIRFFSFYTILTNILVAFCFTARLSSSKSKLYIFFSNPKVLSAVTVYIIVVGLVYNLVLRFLWSPRGLQMIVDEILHTLIPVLFVLYWWFFVQKKDLQWKDIFRWLLYPLVYLIFILFRGAASGFYPYPFVDMRHLGYTKVLINCIFLFFTFLFFSFLLLVISKLLVSGEASDQAGSKDQ